MQKTYYCRKKMSYTANFLQLFLNFIDYKFVKYAKTCITKSETLPKIIGFLKLSLHLLQNRTY